MAIRAYPPDAQLHQLHGWPRSGSGLPRTYHTRGLLLAAMLGTNAQQRLSTLSRHLCGASDAPSSAATASTAAESRPPPAAPQVEPVVVTLRDSHRDAMLPGVGPSTRTVTIRQLVPSDEAAYCAFGGRVTWREGWHYPLFGLPGTDEHFRQVRLAPESGLPG